MAPYYEVFVQRPFSFSGEPQTEYCEVFDRSISFVEKLRIGPRKYLLFGQKPVEFEAYSHDIAVIRIKRDIGLVFKNHSLPEEKMFNTGSEKILFLDFPDGDTRRISFIAGQEFAIFRTSFLLEGRNDQQIRWSGSLDGYGDFFEDLCTREILRQLEPNSGQAVLSGPKPRKMISP